MQSPDLVLGTLGIVATLILIWIIIIHIRVNRLIKEIERLKKIARG